ALYTNSNTAAVSLSLAQRELLNRLITTIGDGIDRLVKSLCFLEQSDTRFPFCITNSEPMTKSQKQNDRQQKVPIDRQH
ncbi:MAG TPA: hypothetical protein PKA76_18955, partial [Pirellulaceae bacterium]|nr:hypothetical protein [Pirellulaceae bacterium]